MTDRADDIIVAAAAGITLEQVQACQEKMLEADIPGPYRIYGISKPTVDKLKEFAAQPRHSKHLKARKARHD